MTITSELVEQVRSKSHTDADLDGAAVLFLDALASAYAGASTDVGKKLIKWAKSDSLNSRSRAFLLGALTHITETDDLHRGSVTHPGCIVVPCLMALGPKNRKTDSCVLEAMLYGFEAMCRIGNAVGPAHYKVWHNTSTCGPFGSAMAAASLLELNEDETVNALGNAGTQSSGFWQFLESGAMSKHLHAGRGSEAGILAAELAQGGFSGPPDILEGSKGLFVAMCPDPEPSKVLAKPGEIWQLLQTSVKPWPSCRHTHPTIDCALDINSRLGNRIIASVEIETYQAALDICDRESVDSEYQAKFSLQHCVSKALLDGEVTLSSFDETARADTALLSTKVAVSVQNPYRSHYPASWGSGVTVTTTNGDELTATRTDCKGDPELPLTTSEMIEKATNLMIYGGLTDQEAGEICQFVLAMPNSTNCTDFMSVFLDRALK